MRGEIKDLLIKELLATEGLDYRKCIKARGLVPEPGLVLPRVELCGSAKELSCYMHVTPTDTASP